MTILNIEEPPLVDEPMVVAIRDGEILLVGRPNPSFSADAARETGHRLIDAADKLDWR